MVVFLSDVTSFILRFIIIFIKIVFFFFLLLYFFNFLIFFFIIIIIVVDKSVICDMISNFINDIRVAAKVFNKLLFVRWFLRSSSKWSYPYFLMIIIIIGSAIIAWLALWWGPCSFNIIFFNLSTRYMLLLRSFINYINIVLFGLDRLFCWIWTSMMGILFQTVFRCFWFHFVYFSLI